MTDRPCVFLLKLIYLDCWIGFKWWYLHLKWEKLLPFFLNCVNWISCLSSFRTLSYGILCATFFQYFLTIQSIKTINRIIHFTDLRWPLFKTCTQTILIDPFRASLWKGGCMEKARRWIGMSGLILSATVLVYTISSCSHLSCDGKHCFLWV